MSPSWVPPQNPPFVDGKKIGKRAKTFKGDFAVQKSIFF
jgi:hypothetical protein